MNSWQDYQEAQSSGGKANSAPVAENDSATDDAGAEESITNNQESGIEEADFVKRTADQILVLHGRTLEVIDRASRTSLGSLDLSDNFSAGWWNQLTPLQIYNTSGRLVILGSTPDQTKQKIMTFQLNTGQFPLSYGAKSLLAIFWILGSLEIVSTSFLSIGQKISMPIFMVVRT